MKNSDGDIYKQPFGGALGQEFQRVWHAIKTNQIVPSVGLRVSKTTGGTILNPSAAGGGASVLTMKVGTSGYAADTDFVYAYMDGGTSQGYDDFKVALPPQLREGTKPQQHAEIRTAYDVDDIIYAVELDKSYEIPTAQGGGEANYLDLNVDGRAWSYQVTHCQNEVTLQFWVPITKYP